MITKLVLSFALTSLCLLCCVGCSLSTRLGYNDEDLKQSKDKAEEFLLNLKNQKYDAAIELTTDLLKTQLQPEMLRADLEGRFNGGTIQSWTFKSHEIIAGPRRRVRMHYSVQGSVVTRVVEITTEVIANPWRWQIAGLDIPNDQVADDNAQKAQPIAEQFLTSLHNHDYAAAHKLMTPLGQKSTSIENLGKLWKSFEESGSRIKGWTLKQHNDTTADLTGQRRSYTILVYQIESAKGFAAIVMTMFNSSAGWQVEGFQVRDDVEG